MMINTSMRICCSYSRTLKSRSPTDELRPTDKEINSQNASKYMRPLFPHGLKNRTDFFNGLSIGGIFQFVGIKKKKSISKSVGRFSIRWPHNDFPNLFCICQANQSF
ncbi:MAG: hypothetical protein ACRENG_25570 [bacterium]